MWTWGSGRTENGEQSRITGLDCSIWQLLASHTGNINQVPQNLACEEETLTCQPAVRNSHFTKLDENIGAPQPFTSSSASWSSKLFTPEMWVRWRVLVAENLSCEERSLHLVLPCLPALKTHVLCEEHVPCLYSENLSDPILRVCSVRSLGTC